MAGYFERSETFRTAYVCQGEVHANNRPRYTSAHPGRCKTKTLWEVGSVRCGAGFTVPRLSLSRRSKLYCNLPRHRTPQGNTQKEHSRTREKFTAIFVEPDLQLRLLYHCKCTWTVIYDIITADNTFCVQCYSMLLLSVMFTQETDTGRLRLKCDGTRAESRLRLSAKRTSPFKSAGASVQSTTGSRGVRISDSNAGSPCSEVVWGVLATHSIRQFPLHFPSRASPCAITFQLDSTSYFITGKAEPVDEKLRYKTGYDMKEEWTTGCQK